MFKLTILLIVTLLLVVSIQSIRVKLSDPIDYYDLQRINTLAYNHPGLGLHADENVTYEQYKVMIEKLFRDKIEKTRNSNIKVLLKKLPHIEECLTVFIREMNRHMGSQPTQNVISDALNCYEGTDAYGLKFTADLAPAEYKHAGIFYDGTGNVNDLKSLDSKGHNSKGDHKSKSY